MRKKLNLGYSDFKSIIENNNLVKLDNYPYIKEDKVIVFIFQIIRDMER